MQQPSPTLPLHTQHAQTRCGARGRATTSSPRTRHAHTHGLTLMELLVVLTCIGLLAALALPSYRGWQQRGQRAQARVALLQAAHWLERSAAANGQYPAADALPAPLRQPAGLHYGIVPVTTAQTFTLSAEPQGTQADDACGILTLLHNGARDVRQASLPASTCWQR